MLAAQRKLDCFASLAMTLMEFRSKFQTFSHVGRFLFNPPHRLQEGGLKRTRPTRCSFQGFNPFRTRRHVARSGERFIGVGIEIAQTRRLLLDVHHPPMSVREDRRKAIVLLPMSWDRPAPAPRGCARIWCISASNAQIQTVPPWTAARGQGPCSGGSGAWRRCAVPTWYVGIRTRVLLRVRREHNTLSHR